MKTNPLGEIKPYRFEYEPTLLYPIPRLTNREENGIDAALFFGYDIWNAYELSWLNRKGKPEVRVLKVIYSSDSLYIIESKSFKLYLNSFTMTAFDSEDDVRLCIENDLRELLGTPFLSVELFNSEFKSTDRIQGQNSVLIDDIDVSVNEYEINKKLLTAEKSEKTETEQYSHLLKTNCPITGQPDWASVYLKYRSDLKVQNESLLKYIISYRNHNGYHESCCEQIFCDVYDLLKPEFLEVRCLFTRRGGIDINPLRSTDRTFKPEMNNYRHFRQ